MIIDKRQNSILCEYTVQNYFFIKVYYLPDEGHNPAY